MSGLFIYCLVFGAFICLCMVIRRSLKYIGKQSVAVSRQKVKVPKIKNLKPSLEEEILVSLEKFEKDKKYLQKDMTLSRMASFMGINARYISAAITKHRGKGFVEYLTDLRIDYAVHLLTTENKYRHYSQQALGEEIGFGSTRIFLKAFRQKTALTPAAFVAKLEA